MSEIFHSFLIKSPINKVFEFISTAEGLESWWTKSSSGKSELGGLFLFFFEPDFQWSAIVSKFIPGKEIEWTMQKADQDWEGSSVGFRLIEKLNETEVQFYHIGWKTTNDHYRFSNFCWAMYLRILKRRLEYGEFVPYEDRLYV